MVPELNFDRTSRLIQYTRIGNFLWLHLPYLGHQVHYQTFSNQSQNLPHIYSIHFALSLFLPQFRDYCPLQLPCLAPWPAGAPSFSSSMPFHLSPQRPKEQVSPSHLSSPYHSLSQHPAYLPGHSIQIYVILSVSLHHSACFLFVCSVPKTSYPSLASSPKWFLHILQDSA